MYYELFDQLRLNPNHQIDASYVQQLINKSYIDTFFDSRSYIDLQHYDPAHDHNRLVGNCYSYIFIQKMIMGISKAVWLGLDPKVFAADAMSAIGRIRVPTRPLRFQFSSPSLYLSDRPGDSIQYESTSLYMWEQLFLYHASDIKKRIGVEPHKDGFRSNLVRTLGSIYGFQSTHPRRCGWMRFIYDLAMGEGPVVLADAEKKYDLKFKTTEVADGFLLQIVEHPKHDYLEYSWMDKLGALSTDKNLNELVQNLTGTTDAYQAYTKLNSFLVGRLPLCHFYLNEHMFVAKEEHLFNDYYEIFVKPWGKQGMLEVFFLENDTKKLYSLPIDDFSKNLKHVKYSIIMGVGLKHSDGFIETFLAQPCMVKDLSLA